MNWDAALCSSTKMVGVGVVLRDEFGTIRAALVSALPYISDPTVAEATTLWKVVRFCSDIGYNQVVF
jgi:hypothetical protein